MQLKINYGVIDLSVDTINSYVGNKKFIKLSDKSSDQDFVIMSEMSHQLFITPDDILCDTYGMSDLNKPAKAVAYYTESKKPTILPDNEYSIFLNLDIENVKEFEYSDFDTYYCRKFFKKEDLEQIYANIEIHIPDLNKMSEVYFQRTEAQIKNDLELPICYWTKNGIICDSILPFLFIHSKDIKEIPIVFVVDKDYAPLTLEFLPKPFFENHVVNTNITTQVFEECAININGKIKYLINITKDEMLNVIKDLSEFHLPEKLQARIEEFGILQVMNIFPNIKGDLGSGKSKCSTSELVYKLFINKNQQSFPVVLSDFETEANRELLPATILSKILTLPLKDYPIKIEEIRIKYSDLFSILEPITLDKSSIASVRYDKRLIRPFLPHPVDPGDKRVHLFLFNSVQPVNLNMLKHYAQDDLVTVVLYYFNDFFYTKKIRNVLLEKAVK